MRELTKEMVKTSLKNLGWQISSFQNEDNYRTVLFNAGETIVIECNGYSKEESESNAIEEFMNEYIYR